MDSNHGTDTDTQKAEKLIEEGLTFYGFGKTAEAVLKWKEVLAIVPGHSLAIEYLGIAGEIIGKASPAGPGKAQSPMDKAISMIKEDRFEEAHAAFEEVVKADSDNPDSYGYELLARTQRLAKYRQAIGDMKKTPQIAMSMDKIKQTRLSKEAGFILSLVDGTIAYEDILALARMERLDAMGHLTKLIEMGIIANK